VPAEPAGFGGTGGSILFVLPFHCSATVTLGESSPKPTAVQAEADEQDTRVSSGFETPVGVDSRAQVLAVPALGE